jgi:FkbM family methyltransferase
MREHGTDAERLDKAPEGRFVGLLRRVLYSDLVKRTGLQGLWRRAYYLSLFAMNYGGASGSIETSGEKWVLANVVAPACARVAAPVVFDVGANVGHYSLLALSLIRGARIYAFEPSPNTYETLRKEIERAGAQASILPEQVGFSNAPGELKLYAYSIDGYEYSNLASVVQRLPTQEATIEVCREESVPVETIDRFCAARSVRNIDLLKIDVEGHELAVLRGAEGMLNSGAVRFIQFEFGPANIYSRTYFYDFWEMLSGKYALHRIVPRGIIPITEYREQNEVFLTSNFLAIRKDGAPRAER